MLVSIVLIIGGLRFPQSIINKFVAPPVMTVTYFDNPDTYHKIIAQLKDTLTFVAFSATWCPPCRAVAPFYEKYSEEYPKAVFYKIQGTDDEDEEKDKVNKEAKIFLIPTFIAFRNGRELDRLSSGDPHYLKLFLDKNYDLFA